MDKVGGPTAAGVPWALAALADEAQAYGLDAPTSEALEQASRLEPAVQMFALRAHLMAALGTQPTFGEVADHVLDAHECSPPSMRGRLTTAEVLQLALLSLPPRTPNDAFGDVLLAGLAAGEAATPPSTDGAPAKTRAGSSRPVQAN